MSTTTTTALASTLLVGTLPTMTNAVGMISDKSCPTCGSDRFSAQGTPAGQAQSRVKELEGQLEFLNVQATQMAERMAEYEEEIRRLRAQSTTQSSRNGSSVSSTSSIQLNRITDLSMSPPSLQTSPKSQGQHSGRLSTLTSLLPSRRPGAPSTTQAQPVISPPPIPSYEETLALQNALNREQSLRKAAETQLSQASTELEELTAQLFSQANEMVAQERKARARLEERVAVLERRDVEKRTRLERLEKAMERVERIRAMVG
ncbi:uncharacterized protein BP01DRAFT_360267 [Aspergillus saccharolyticus JOP 1030-1]|uniref:GDP/GTP exchange factor Sec2 N-terminal domain-containing protein n=1 Tax=Aspergillus saccharolyticus JOP 1030-1 TaxID=1450539 RepID=A0A318Z5J1_9EURO|nr:hypothetical protein BP01DRAFT_360267 [Aspergillus saccharolyticus JOP 1030-1]PYH41617.1 hypothetical protein BP01DRAFT_360267 [Aspergillus saccharolyticus JOP 1030-1]